MKVLFDKKVQTSFQIFIKHYFDVRFSQLYI